MEDHAGDIWIGTQNDGLYKYSAGNFTHYPSERGVYQNVTALYEDREGRLWIGGRGALSWSKDGRLTNLSDRLGLPYDFVRVILQDRAGRFWIGTEHGLESLADCSIVVAPYLVEGETGGTIGVLGPTRMNYPQALAAVAVVSKRLGTRLAEG